MLLNRSIFNENWHCASDFKNNVYKYMLINSLIKVKVNQLQNIQLAGHFRTQKITAKTQQRHERHVCGLLNYS